MTQEHTYTKEERYAHIREAIGELITKGQEYIQQEQLQNPGEEWSNDIASQIAQCRDNWNRQIFKVAVLALVKAGKSTLINSWLGNEYMPASSVPETARIVRVIHTPGNQRGTLTDRDRVPIHGAVEICDYLRRLNAEVREQGTIPPEDELVLEAPLVALENSPLGKQGFEILDTPGPNEAGTDLKEKVEKILNEVAVIIYLLDYTKLKTVEEAEMFAKLAEVRLDLLNSERLFFVVNKVDVLNRDCPTLADTADYIAKVLRDQIPDLKITPERILFISAEEALLARLVESGHASSKALKDFAQKAFGILDEEEHTLEECQLLSPRFFRRSRMIELEKMVLTFIYSRRGIILLESLLGDLDRHLGVFYNQLLLRKGTWQANQHELESKVKELEGQLDDINQKLEGITRSTTDFQEEIENFLEGNFSSFQDNVDNMINDAFSSASSRSVDWPFYKIFFGSQSARRIDETLNNFASKIKGWLNTSSSDKRQVEEAAQKLNEEIVDHLNRGFQQFLQDLSGQLQRKQRPFFDKLGQEVASLSKKIEEVIGEALQVALLPVPVIFNPPPQLPLEEAISRGVKSTSETRTGSREERYVRFKVFWIPIYGTKTVYYRTSSTKHEIDAVAIRQFWQKEIGDTMQKIEQDVDKQFNQEFRTTIQQAEQQLRRFSDNYINNIKRDMAEVSQGEQQRKELLAQVEQRLQQLTELLKKIADYRGVLDQMKATL